MLLVLGWRLLAKDFLGTVFTLARVSEVNVLAIHLECNHSNACLTPAASDTAFHSTRASIIAQNLSPVADINDFGAPDRNLQL